MKIIAQCESLGHFLDGEQDCLRIQDIDNLPPGLLETLQKNKKQVLDSLKRDNLAKKAGALIGISGEVYLWTLSARSFVYLERENDDWISYRAYYPPNHPPRFQLIAIGKAFEYVIKKVEKYLKYLFDK